MENYVLGRGDPPPAGRSCARSNTCPVRLEGAGMVAPPAPARPPRKAGFTFSILTFLSHNFSEGAPLDE